MVPKLVLKEQKCITIALSFTRKGAEDNHTPSPFAASEQARSGDETSDGVSELSPTWIAKSFIPVGGCHCSWSSPRTHNFFCPILSRLCARQQGHARGDRTRTHGRGSRAHTMEPLAAATGRPRIAPPDPTTLSLSAMATIEALGFVNFFVEVRMSAYCIGPSVSES